MAVYDLEEQEQIAQFKAWWGSYGNLIVGIVLAVVIGFVGWRLWDHYQTGQADKAGAVYFTLQEAVARNEAQQTFELAGELISRYSGTLQAQLGALLSAGVQFREHDFDHARTQLEWAAKDGKDPFLRQLARLRLAAVLLQQGATDEALARLQPAPEGALRVRFEDLRGDVLAAQGKASEARAAWSAALDALSDVGESAAPLRGLIRDKLESLEG
ncbi:MAG: tetratricopeptide repeat protein [Azoarcus sp.]|jgi:predicted negative regulator of RcsB-dependent stress response|nr:tetratricopeptide repeat protein [Azoarcus sp.]